MKKITLAFSLSAALFFLLIGSATSWAAPKMKMDIKFDKAYYSTTDTVNFTASVINPSPETWKHNRIILNIYNRLADGESLINVKTKNKEVLIRRYWFDNLPKGKTDFVFNRDLAEGDLGEGAYPVEVVAELGGKQVLKKSSFLVLLDHKDQSLPVALVWDWHRPSELGPDGVFASTRLANLIGSVGAPGVYSQYLSTLEQRQGVKTNLAITPALLDDVRSMTGGYMVQSGGKKKTVSTGKTPALAAKSLLEKLSDLAKSVNRVEIMAGPYSYPSLPVLASSNLAGDIGGQLKQGQAVTKSIFRLRESPKGVFSPNLDLDPKSAERLLEKGVSYTIVSQEELALKPRTLTPLPYRLASEKGRSLVGFVADPAFSKVVTESSAGELPARLNALFAMRLLSTKKRPGAVVALLSNAGSNQEPSAAAMDEVFHFFERTPWLHTETLAALTGTLPRAEGKLKDWRPGRVDNKYVDKLVQAHQELADFSNSVSSGNQLLRKMEENLLRAESSDWAYGSRVSGKNMGLSYLQAIKKTIDKTYANIKIAPAQTITFSSNQGKIPIAVTNNNSFPLQITLRFDGKDFSYSDDKENKVVLMPKDNLVVYQVKANYRGSSVLRVILASGSREIASGQITVMVSDIAKYILTAISAMSLILIAALILRKRPKGA